MTIALWCVLAGAILPYIYAAVAKVGAPIDNHTPRDSADALEGYRRRAFAAHLNGFEAFPFFAAAVIVAQMQGAPQMTVDNLALGWVAARLVYVVLYIANIATLRSVVWTVATVLSLAIFTAALWA